MVKKVLLTILFLIALFFLAIWSYLQTSHAQKMILGYVSEIIKKNTGYEVEIEGFSIRLPFNGIAYRVKIKDDQKIRLSVDELEVTFHPRALFNQKIHLKKVSLSHDPDNQYDILLYLSGNPLNSYEGQFHVKALDRPENLNTNISGVFFLSSDQTLNPEAAVYQLKVHSVKGSLGPLAFDGLLSLNLADLKIHEAKFKIHLSDYSSFTTAVPISGTAQADVTASGTLMSPSIHFNISGNHLKLYEKPIENFSGEATFSTSSKGIVGQAFLNLDYQQQSIKAQADFQLDESLVNFNIETAKVRYAEFKAEKAILSGIVRDLFHSPHAEIFLDVQKVLYKGWRFHELKLETSIARNLHFWPFKIHLQDGIENIWGAKAAGRWRGTGDELDIHLDTLYGSIKNYPFNMEGPVSIFMQKNVLDISPLTLTVGKGSLFTAIDYRSDQAHATAQLKEIPIEIFYPPHFKPPFTGILSGEAYLLKSPNELTGRFQANFHKIKVSESTFEQTPSLEAELSGNLVSSHLICTGKLLGVTPKPIEISADLPLITHLDPPLMQLDLSAPLSAHLFADGDLAPLLQLLAIDATTMTGKTSVQLDVTGTFNDPHVSGAIAIANGTFESPNTGAFFHHLNAYLEAQDKTLILKEFKALDLSDGIIQGKGILKLRREEGFPFTLNLNLSRIRLLNLDFIKSIASGDVVITGNSQKGKIKGSLITDSVQATLLEQAPALAHSLNVKYINLQKGEVSPLFTTSRSRWPLEFDVEIKVLKKATIKSKKLSSYWQGAVKVGGFDYAPQIFGEFKIIKGDYNFNGKIFDIKEGTISFSGEPDKKTNLYVIASKDLGKIIAEVILKGPVKNPAIAFRSNPPMSQREILSWILFGRGSTDITPFQGAELSKSIHNLAEKSQNEDVLTKIRDKMGIDRIDIKKAEGSESNEVSLQVGKYISRKVLLKVNKGITSQSNQVGIEANILPNIKAEAQVGDDSSTQLQLKWKRDY